MYIMYNYVHLKSRIHFLDLNQEILLTDINVRHDNIKSNQNKSTRSLIIAVWLVEVEEVLGAEMGK